MSTERADQLHQQASEHYLQGEYAEAIAAWGELLEFDPGNEQAIEGVRMSRLLSDGEGGAVPAPEAEIDLGLRVFDSIPKPAAPARDPNPNETMLLDRSAVEGMLREGSREAADAPEMLSRPAPEVMHEVPGFDFGDLESLSAIPLAAAPGVDPPSADATDSPAGAFDAPDEEASGLSPVVEERRPHLQPASAAAELVLRLKDLLAEARGKVEAGERDEALSLLARVFILDEENAEARRLEAQIELTSGTTLADIETHLIEGVQAFDQGRHEEAKVHFRKVLESHPEHREALHYLEKIQEQEASFGDIPEDLLASAPAGPEVAMPASGPDSPDLSIEPAAPPRQAPRVEAPVASAARAMPTPSRRPLALSPKLVGLAVGLVVVGAAAYFIPKLFSGAGGSSEAEAPVVATPRPRPAKPATATPTPAPPAAAPTPAMTLDQAMTKARGAMAAADYGAAVMAYKAALDLDKTHLEALEGIRQAGDAYKTQKADQEQFDRVAMAFRDGEYASGLRLLYRLPPTVDRGRIDRYKADGWFNLGVVALRAGDVSAAIGHFEDALAIRPDPESTKWRSFSQRYRDLPKDRGFYDAVEAIPFRQIQ